MSGDKMSAVDVALLLDKHDYKTTAKTVKETLPAEAILLPLAGGKYSKIRETCRRILAAEVRRLRAEREWQPIETAPEDGTEVLLSGFLYKKEEKGRWVTLGYYGRQAKAWVNDEGEEGSKLHPPTHWMPLPAAPESKGGEA